MVYSQYHVWNGESRESPEIIKRLLATICFYIGEPIGRYIETSNKWKSGDQEEVRSDTWRNLMRSLNIDAGHELTRHIWL